MSNLRDRIKAADDKPMQRVEIPEWGDDSGPMVLYVRTMGSVERDDYEAMLIEGRGKNQKVTLRNARAKFATCVVVDEEGNPVFTPDDVEWLGDKSAKVLDRLVDIGQVLCGMRDGDLEHLVGN